MIGDQLALGWRLAMAVVKAAGSRTPRSVGRDAVRPIGEEKGCRRCTHILSDLVAAGPVTIA